MGKYIFTKLYCVRQNTTETIFCTQVDFFWINRDQRSFEWFVNLLSQLEIEQAELGGAMERFLEMHMYITSALQKTDMKAVGLQLALDLLHEKVSFCVHFQDRNAANDTNLKDTGQKSVFILRNQALFSFCTVFV